MKDFGKGLQDQIDNLDKYNKDKVTSDYEMGQQDLTNDNFLRLNYHFNQCEGEGSVPTYERDGNKLDWKKEVYHEPRAFTIKNFRDLFFGMMNQSKAQQRIYDAEENIRKLYEECKRL